MSGTSSSTSSSTSGRGSFSSSSPDRESSSTVSPERRGPSSSSSTISQTRSSSARPTIKRATAAEDLADRHDLAGQILASRQHDAERLVQHDLGAPVQTGEHVGHRGDPHLAATGVDVDRVVVVDLEDGAVRRRWLGELLDLFAQRRDVLARLTQGVGELLVLADRLGELALRLEQPLLERAHPLRCVLEAPAQAAHLFFEVGRLTPQLGQLRFVRSNLALVIRGGHWFRPAS